MLGSFRLDRAVKDAHPIIGVHSNDVSLLSCAFGTLAAGGKFLIAFKGRLAIIEGRVTDQPVTAHVVAIEEALVMVKYKCPAPYAQTYFTNTRSRRTFEIR